MARRSKLDIIVTANTGQATSALGGVSQSVGSLGRNVKIAGALIAGLTSISTIRGLKDMVRNLVNAGDAMFKMTRQTGLSEGLLDVLNRVSIGTRQPAKSLIRDFTNLRTVLQNVDDPTSKLGSALEELNIPVAGFKALDPIKQYLVLLREIRKLSPTRQRNAMKDLFGGDESLRFGAGPRAFRGAIINATKFGDTNETVTTMSAQIAKNWETAAQSITNAKEQLLLITGILPGLLRISEFLAGIDFGGGVQRLTPSMTPGGAGTNLRRGITGMTLGPMGLTPGVQEGIETGGRMIQLAADKISEAVIRYTRSVNRQEASTNELIHALGGGP